MVIDVTGTDTPSAFTAMSPTLGTLDAKVSSKLRLSEVPDVGTSAELSHGGEPALFCEATLCT